MGDNDPPMDNQPPKGGGDTGAPPGGNGDDGRGSSDDQEMGEGDREDVNEEDPKESGEEDPVSGQTGKEYVSKTKEGKEMARMLVSFCHLSKSSANTIVVYFGVSTMDKLADFREEHWKDTFVQWQKCHTCPDGLEQVLVLSPPQQDRIRCVAWACRYHHQIFWPPGAFLWMETPSYTP